MGRLIDEDDVLNVLCHELCHPGARCPDGYCEEMREKLKDVPTADAVPRWIPCSERLPDYDVEVLATTEWGGITIAERLEPRTGEKDDWWFLAEGNINGEKDDVIAWMPLPEPYKEGGI